MRLLLYSGILYLAGVAIILALKPTLMFREDGGWKEFGIGRNPDKYTWFPFWFFVIVWAIISYCIILILASIGILPGIDLRANGSFNNSRNLSKNMYNVKNEILPVVEANEFLDGDEGEGEPVETSEPFETTEPTETEIDTEMSPFQKLEELEVTAPKSNSRSTVRGRRVAQPLNLKKGYYILNTNTTRSSGVPKYIYLGPEAPRVLYR